MAQVRQSRPQVDDTPARLREAERQIQLAYDDIEDSFHRNRLREAQALLWTVRAELSG